MDIEIDELVATLNSYLDSSPEGRFFLANKLVVRWMRKEIYNISTIEQV
jgi:hypothetical protein